MTHLAVDWLDWPESRAVMSALDAVGLQGWYVGGCVRNALLGQAVSDIDIATNGLPEQVVAAAEAAGLKAIPTGIDHGTITVVAGEIPFEITTFRNDLQTDGRRAVVSFSTRIEDDAARRDFTMNALYAQADGTVVDPLGGLDDLTARRVRFVGDPDARIAEDYLRILRFFRFFGWYGADGDGPDAEGLAACASHLDGLDGLSRERIGTEMVKLLSAPDPSQALGAMEQTGVLSRLLPGATIRAVLPLIHFEPAPDAMRRLAALGEFDLWETLRLPRKAQREVALIRQTATGTDTSAQSAWRHGAEIARSAALLRAALFETPPQDDLEAELTRGATAQLPVSARDLMPAYQGAALGARLEKLTNYWLGQDFKPDRQRLLDLP